MLEVWSILLSFFNSVTSAVGMVLIFESFFHRRCRGKRFWEILLLWYFCNVCLQFGPWSGQTALVMSVGSCLVNFALILASYRARWDRAFFVAVTAYALGSAPNYWMDRIAMVLFGLTYDELVLGNLLDNAMEACGPLPERDRWVEAKILYHAQGDPPCLSVSVVNPSRPVTVEDGQIATTKADPLLHGFGLQNVRDILDRYGAEYTCFYEEGRFVFSADWPDRPPESGPEKSPRSRHRFPRS